MIRRPPRSTRTDTLSRHDALPICFGLLKRKGRVDVRIDPKARRMAKDRIRRLTARSWSVSMPRSEEHTSELQSLMRISYAVFCLKKKTKSRTTRSTYRKNKNTQIRTQPSLASRHPTMNYV